MGDRKGHRIGSKRNCAARRGTKREGLARSGGETIRALEEDSLGGLTAVAARTSACVKRSGKTTERVRFPQRWFTRNAFRAHNSFASPESSEWAAGDKDNPGDRSRRRLDRRGVCCS